MAPCDFNKILHRQAKALSHTVIACQDMIIFDLLFRPILPSFIDDYLLFHRHFLNGFMTLTILMIPSPLNKLEQTFHWDATDY